MSTILVQVHAKLYTTILFSSIAAQISKARVYAMNIHIDGLKHLQQGHRMACIVGGVLNKYTLLNIGLVPAK